MAKLSVFEVQYADDETPATDYIVVSEYRVAAAVSAKVKRPIMSLQRIGSAIVLERIDADEAFPYQKGAYNSETNAIRAVDDTLYSDGCDCGDCSELRGLLDTLSKKKKKDVLN